ncbi:HAD family hydrolase [Kitasatospora sp. NPDC088779]|uniref:HAD family hydrolase n=1 Tax=Kitasatospora sp. NPDC088779 TaxID=3154964 RepID=UPI0034121B18
MNTTTSGNAGPQIRGLLVDLDGVVRLWHRAGARAAEAELSLPDRHLSRYTTNRFSDAAHAGALTWEQWTDGVRERLAADLGPEAAERATALWTADRGQVNQEMAALLRRARTAGLSVALLTNNTTVLDRDLAHHGIDGLFDHVLNSAATGLAKPSRLAFEDALAHMGLAPGEVAFTDDSDLNTAAAAALGLHAHHFRQPGGAAAFEAYLAALGVTLPPEPARVPLPTEPGTGAPPGHGDHDRHRSVHVRYLATGLSAEHAARHLPTAAWAQPLGEHTLATGSSTGAVTVWRLTPAGTHVRHAAGHPDAWMPQPVPGGAEYLPPWTTATRAQARPHAEALLTEAALALTQLADSHRAGDRLGAALHLQAARHALTRAAVLLARRQARPWPDAIGSRYLTPAVAQHLATSLAADPTTPTGLATSLRPLLEILAAVRHDADLVLTAGLAWPWQDLARALGPVLGDDIRLHPATDTPSLYGAALAATYDEHRPVGPHLAAALRAFATRTLTGLQVVELGAGTGRITAHLAHTAAGYTATEPSAAMAQHLSALRLPAVRVLLADALALPLADSSADVVVEHEVLLFAADPLAAADQALRILRPGGQLVRLLLHSSGQDPAADLDAAYRRAAFTDGPAPLITGKGTDHLITRHLADRGLATAETVLAQYTETRTPHQALNALAARAWPYQHQASEAQHEAGMAAAHRRARTLPTIGRPVRMVLRALTTTAEGTR